MRNFVIFFMAISSLCFAGEKSEIVMASGKTVSDCNSFNELRNTESLLEDSMNMLASSEYLECSLVSNLEQVSSVEEFIHVLNKNLRIRQFPLSLGPQVDRKSLLNEKFNFDGKFSLKYEKDLHKISITYKGKISEGRHLVWVVDEILDATYRAYYPAVVVVSSDRFAVEPYYGGGF